MAYRHPARLLPFDDLLTALTAEVDAGRVAVVREGPLALYKYTDRCTYDRSWTPTAMMARGLILDLDARAVVASPFEKFFNHSEGCAPNTPMDPLPDEPFVVTEKVDGSLAIVFWHDGRWHVCTRGSFTSEQARWAAQWLTSGPGRDYRDVLTPGHTYCFEIVYAANRIVIGYDFEGLVLLAAFDADGYEYERAALEMVAADAGERVVRIEHTGASIADLLAIAQTLSAQEEGFVVRFASGRRIKIKGDEYCRIHRLVSRVTPLAVHEMLAAGDDVLAIRQQLPEEFCADFDRIVELLTDSFRVFRQRVEDMVAICAEKSDRDVGLWMAECARDGDLFWIQEGAACRWIFPVRKHDALNQMLVAGSEWRRKAFDTFRPTGNQLGGYTPSNAMNRFEAAL